MIRSRTDYEAEAQKEKEKLEEINKQNEEKKRKLNDEATNILFELEDLNCNMRKILIKYKFDYKCDICWKKFEYPFNEITVYQEQKPTQYNVQYCAHDKCYEYKLMDKEKDKVNYQYIQNFIYITSILCWGKEKASEMLKELSENQNSIKKKVFNNSG